MAEVTSLSSMDAQWLRSSRTKGMQNNYFQPGMAKVSAAAALGAEKTDLNNS
jgi:hypothetical protein